MLWKLILLAIISILIGLYMNNRMKEYEKDEEIELAAKYATYRNIFYILALLLSFGALWLKINKKSDKYSYKIIDMRPEEEDDVNYLEPTPEDIKVEWIQKFADLKGSRKKGKKLLEKFREKYGLDDPNLESIVMASIENEKCALGKKFIKKNLKKRDECFDVRGIESSVFDYPLARGKSLSIKDLPCNQVQKTNMGLGKDIITYCDDTLRDIKLGRDRPPGHEDKVPPSRFSSKTREIGGPSAPI